MRNSSSSGENYGETVRNITIGEAEIFSNELCGGTHVENNGDIGLFLITKRKQRGCRYPAY
jgi:alanyl-tRNA synthetase